MTLSILGKVKSSCVECRFANPGSGISQRNPDASHGMINQKRGAMTPTQNGKEKQLNSNGSQLLCRNQRAVTSAVIRGIWRFTEAREKAVFRRSCPDGKVRSRIGRTLPTCSPVVPVRGMSVFAFPVTTTSILATRSCLGT